MKTRPFFFGRLLLPTAALISFTGSAHAASGIWQGLIDGTWAGANWSATPVPGTGDKATFNAASSFTTIDLGAGVTIKDLLFDTSAAAYTIGSGAVNSQTLNLNDAGTITMNSTVGNDQLFNSTVTLGTAIGGNYSFTNNSPSKTLFFAGNILGGTGGTAAAKTLTVGGAGNTSISGIIGNGGASSLALLKSGSGILTLSKANTYTGNTTVGGGTLKLDFTAAGAPTGATGIITGSALKLGGGTLQIVGASGGNTQTFASTSFTAATGGTSIISAAPVSGTIPVVNLGTLTGTQGALVRFDGAAYNSGASSGTTLGGSTVASTATFNTTTNTLAGGVITNSTAGTGYGSYATVGLYDWAAISTGTSGTATAGSVVGLSQISGGYTVVNTLTTGLFGGNYDLTANAQVGGGSTSISGGLGSIRINTNAAITLSSGRAAGNSVLGALLITPNVGVNNITIALGSSGVPLAASRATSGATGFTLWQNNTLGELLFNSGYTNGANSALTASYTQGGPGTVVMGASNTYTGLTYLDGGTTVIANNNQVGAVATGASVNINGGTLFGNANFTLDNAGANLRPIALSGAGGTLAASAGNTFTISGVISGSSDLKIGTGTIAGTGAGTANTTAVIGNGIVALTNSANTLTGATTVTNGTLMLSGSGAINSTSGITINGSGAKLVQTSSTASTPAITLIQGTLDGTTTVGAVTVRAGTGGIVANGNGASNTALTAGSLNFLGAGTVSLRLAGGATTNSPGLAVSGLLTTGGTVTVNLTPGIAWNNGSIYQLISYGTFSGSAANFSLGSAALSGRQSGTFAASGGLVTLDVEGDSPAWTGTNGSQWTQFAQNSAVSGTPNFALKTGHTATDFWVGDSVEFNDTYNLGAGDVPVTQTTVTIHGGSVSPNSAAFNNSAVNYILNSDDGSGISAGSLTKTGSGSLTITTTNGYTGSTTISTGTLQIGDGTTDGSISSTSNIVDNSALVYNLVGSQSYGGAISGSGTLTKSGAGTLTLTGASNYGGSTTISAGTLQIGNGTTDGSITSNITDNAALAYNLVGSQSYAGVISGTGTVSKTGAGTITLSGPNTYTGSTSVNAGTINLTGSSGSTGARAGAVAVNSGAFNVSGGTLTGTSLTMVNSGGTSLSLTGSGTIDLNGNFAVGSGGNASNSFASLVNGTVTVNSMTIGRTSNTTSGFVAAASTTNGVYVTGATVNVATTLGIGNNSSANSGSSLRMDSGSVTVGGLTTVTSNNSGRYGVLDINGGTFTAGTGGVTIGGSFAGAAGEVLVRAGTLTTSMITMGTATQTSGNNTLQVSGGTLYVGAGSITGITAGTTTNTINLAGGTLAASADWSSSLGMNLTNTPTIQAADSGGTGHDIALSGILAGAGGFNKTGSGVLTLNSAGNTYSGLTTINGGTLNINSEYALGGANYSGLTFGATGGTLQYASTLLNSTTDITFSGSAKNVTLTGNATIDTNGNDVSYASTFGNSGAGSLTKSGLGALTLSAASTYTGGTAVKNGSLVLDGGTDRLLGTGSVVIGDVSTTGKLVLGGTTVADQTLVGLTTTGSGGSVVGGNSSNSRLTLNIASGTNTFGGVLGGAGSNEDKLALTKVGAGTLALSNANTYTGTTTISNGTLALGASGSIANSSAIQIASGATLDVSAVSGWTVGASTAQKLTGSGGVTGAATIGALGTHNVGDAAVNNGVGSQTFSSTLNYGSGSIFEWDLSAASASDIGVVADGATGTYDTVVANGAVTGGSAIFKVMLGGNTFADAFWDTDKSWSNIFSGTGAPVSLASIFSSFSATGGLDSTGVVDSEGQFTFNGSTATLNWTAYSAVPEPTSSLVGLLVAAGLMRRRRA